MKILTLLCVVFVAALVGNVLADSSKSIIDDLDAGMSLKVQKLPYTGPPNIPDPNVILQGGDTIEDATKLIKKGGSFAHFQNL